MKKLTKTLIALGCVATLSAGVCALAACGDSEKTGEAYGLSHGAGYVSYASVTVKGDKVTAATLTEVCFPTQVTAPATVAEDDKVTVEVTSHGTTSEQSYYKTISYGSVTMTYDATAKSYKVGDKTIVEYFQTEANCKAYYEAVINNNISVKIGTEEKKDIMTKAALSKEENGYWKNASGSALTPVEGKTFWMLNRDATVNYVVENGVEGLASLTRATADDVHSVWMAGTVSTGATWNDLYAATAPSNYLTYAQLLTKAYNAAK